MPPEYISFAINILLSFLVIIEDDVLSTKNVTIDVVAFE